LGKKKNTQKMMEELVGDQRRDGSFRDVRGTVTCSEGESQVIETTSLALMAMMKVDYSVYRPQIKRGISYLMYVMERGFFASSQASVLAFKVLTEYLQKVEPKKHFPRFQIKINGVANHIQTGDPLLKHKNSK
jgi:hypothetical protein